MLPLALAGLLLTIPREAHAYIDPTTGGILLQVIIGTVIGGIVWFRQQLTFLAQKLLKWTKPKSRQK